MRREFNYFDFEFEIVNNKNASLAIKKYNGHDKVIYIPSTINDKPIVSIDSKAFADNKNIKVVILSKLVVDISNEAFENTEYVTIYTPHHKEEVNFGMMNNVTIRYGFEKAVDIEGIIYSLFDDGKAYVFDHALLDFRFERFGHIGEMIEMETIIDEKYVVEGVEHFALYNAINTKMIALPKQLKWIGVQSFANNEQLEEIILGDTLTNIMDQALDRSSQLKRLVVPKSVIHMGHHVLSDVYRASIFLENEKLGLKWDTDWNPNQLTTYFGFQDFIIQDEIMYALLEGNKAIVIGNNFQTIRDLVIPDTITYENVIYTVTEIASAAFFESRYLKSIVLNDNIKAIHDAAFAHSNLVKIQLPNQLEHLGSGVLLDNIFLKELILPQNLTIIPSALCNNCLSLEKVVMGPHVKVIEAEAFMTCHNLSHINLPLSLEIVQSYAFYGTAFAHMIFGYAIKEIQDLACAEMMNLSSLVILNKDCVIGDMIVSLSDVRIYIEGDEASKLYQTLSQYELVKPRIFIDVYKVQIIEGIAYLITEYDVALVIGHNEDEINDEVRILDYISSCKVNRINSNAFNNSHKITSIYIPDSVNYLPDNFINGCTLLKKIEVPYHLKDIKPNESNDIEIIVHTPRDEESYINEMYDKVKAFVKRKNYMNIDEIQEKFDLKYETAKEIKKRLTK